MKITGIRVSGVTLSKGVMIVAITAHAAVRWLERIAGIDVAGIRRELMAAGVSASDGAVLDALGVTVKDFGTILTPGIIRGIAAGAKRIKDGRAIVVVEWNDGAPTVVTVIDKATRAGSTRRANVNGRRVPDWRQEEWA